MWRCRAEQKEGKEKGGGLAMVELVGEGGEGGVKLEGQELTIGAQGGAPFLVLGWGIE